MYIDKILEPFFKPWLQAHHDFVLEEDGDSGHGPRKSNIGAHMEGAKWPGILFQLSQFSRPGSHRELLAAGETDSS